MWMNVPCTPPASTVVYVTTEPALTPVSAPQAGLARTVKMVGVDFDHLLSALIVNSTVLVHTALQQGT